MSLHPNRLRRPLGRLTLFAKIWFKLLSVRVTLSVHGYPHFEKGPVKVNPNKSNLKPEKYALAVYKAARFVPGALCLAQAITAQRGLARLGFETTIRIGVKSDEHENLLAHAWLLYKDRVILGGSNSEIKKYETMTDITSAITK